MSQPIAPAVPFAFSASGSVAVEQSPTAQLRDRVTALASTQPGQRPMAVGFGLPTSHLLFSFGDPLSTTEISTDLTKAMTVYEPRAVLTSVTPIADPSGTGIAAVVAQAARKDTSSVTSSAAARTTVKISVGGAVTDYASTTSV